MSLKRLLRLLPVMVAALPGSLAAFPAGANVQVEGVGSKAISSLEMGDRALAVDQGRLAFSDVYLFGSNMQNDTEECVELMVTALGSSTEHVVCASHRHFIHACVAPDVAKCQWGQHDVWVYFKDVAVGQYVWMDEGGALAVGYVTGVRKRLDSGLYQPYTLVGTLVVDGVVTSVHTDWLLDDVLPSSRLKQLPRLYQAMFAPLRWAYGKLGAEAWTALLRPVQGLFNAVWAHQLTPYVASVFGVLCGILCMQALSRLFPQLPSGRSPGGAHAALPQPHSRRRKNE